MKFRKIQDNTNWSVFNNIIHHNVSMLGRLRIPRFLLRSYAKLISFYPFTESQESTYFNLSLTKRIPFLMKYLVKVGRKNGLGKSTIKRLFELKNDYDKKRNDKYSDTERTDRMMMYLLSKDYDSILNLHLTDDKISTSFINLAEYTKLLINHIIDDKIVKIRKNHKQWNIDRDNNQIQMGNIPQPIIREQPIGRDYREDRMINPNTQIDEPDVEELREVREVRRKPKIKKSRSFSDLNIKMDKVSKNVSEWDRFIEREVQRRLEKTLNKGNDKKSDYDSFSYSNSATSSNEVIDYGDQHIPSLQ